MIEAVRKINLGRALDQLRSLYPEEYNFHPRSWFLPQQYAEFARAAGGRCGRSSAGNMDNSWSLSGSDRGLRRNASSASNVDSIMHRLQADMDTPSSPPDGSIHNPDGNRPVYIVKPDEGSQGEGIYLIQV